MSISTVRVDVPGGSLAVDVHDPADRRRDVLFVHAPGYCSDVWSDTLAAVEKAGLPWRAVALDLRGHGFSTALPDDPDQLWQDIALVVDALGLDRPILVGHDFGAFYCAAAAAEHDLASAILAVEYPMFSRADAQDYLEAVHSDEVLDLLADRFLFGATGPASDLEPFLDSLVARITEDWVTTETGTARARAAAVRQTRVDPDGSYVRNPTLDTMATITSMRPDTVRRYPDDAIFDDVTCPVLIAQSADGHYQDHIDLVDAVASRRANRRVRILPFGHQVHETEPRLVVSLIEDLVATL